MSVLHLEADVKLPHDSLVVIAVHYTGSHADISYFRISLTSSLSLYKGFNNPSINIQSQEVSV